MLLVFPDGHLVSTRRRWAPWFTATGVSLATRLRRSSGIERQQVKWFTYVAAIAGVSLGLSVVTRDTAADVAGPLTAALVGTYLLLVLVFQVALRPPAGASDLAVATSTLAVAELFRPLRARTLKDPLPGSPLHHPGLRTPGQCHFHWVPSESGTRQPQPAAGSLWSSEPRR